MMFYIFVDPLYQSVRKFLQFPVTMIRILVAQFNINGRNCTVRSLRQINLRSTGSVYFNLLGTQPLDQ